MVTLTVSTATKVTTTEVFMFKFLFKLITFPIWFPIWLIETSIKLAIAISMILGVSAYIYFNYIA